jgi:hypothetical protein
MLFFQLHLFVLDPGCPFPYIGAQVRQVQKYICGQKQDCLQENPSGTHPKALGL